MDLVATMDALGELRGLEVLVAIDRFEDSLKVQLVCLGSARFRADGP